MDSDNTMPSTVRSLKTDRLQHRKFGNSLAHRLRHRVARHQQQCEENGTKNQRDDQRNIAELLHKRLCEGRFGAGLCLVGGIGKLQIDSVRHLYRIRAFRDAQYVPAGSAFAERPGFVEIVVLEKHQCGAAARVVRRKNTVELEFPHATAVGLRPDRCLNRNPVADFPAIGGRKFLPDNGAGTIAFERLELFRRHIEFRVHIEVGLRVNRKLTELVARFLVVAAEPARMCYRLDAVGRRDTVQVAHRQRVNERDLVDNDQTFGIGDVDAATKCKADCRQQCEQQERDEYRQDRQ